MANAVDAALSNRDYAVLWEKAKSKEISLEDFAKRYGYSKATMSQKTYRGREALKADGQWPLEALSADSPESAWREGGGDTAISRKEPDEPGEKRTVLEAWEDAHGELPGWHEILEHARQGAELQKAFRPVRTHTERKINTPHEHIFVVSMSDFHLGSPATDYEAFLETTNLILNDERFFIMVCGPDMEMAFAWFRAAEAVLNQTIPPFLQVEAYRLWLDEMLPRTIAVTGDNHGDERLERQLGDIGVLWRDDVPYFRAMGRLDLSLQYGDDEPVGYEVVMAHRYKGSSIYHDLQPALRLMRDFYPLADIYVTAHTHSPAFMRGVFFKEARPLKPLQNFVVNGSFKTGNEDLHSLRNFGSSGVLGLPTLCLGAREYDVEVYKSPFSALEHVGSTSLS
jgi:hypothetical protein